MWRKSFLQHRHFWLSVTLEEMGSYWGGKFGAKYQEILWPEVLLDWGSVPKEVGDSCKHDACPAPSLSAREQDMSLCMSVPSSSHRTASWDMLFASTNRQQKKGVPSFAIINRAFIKRLIFFLLTRVALTIWKVGYRLRKGPSALLFGVLCWEQNVQG